MGDYNKGFDLLAEAKEENAVLAEALRIACADAWPGESQWPALYLQRAKSNLSVAKANALTPIAEAETTGGLEGSETND